QDWTFSAPLALYYPPVVAGTPFVNLWPNPTVLVQARQDWSQTYNPNLVGQDTLPTRNLWTNPTLPIRQRQDWQNSFNLNLVGQDQLPLNQDDWPVPKGRTPSIDLRTWTQSPDPFGQDQLPFNQKDWPVPKGRPPGSVDLRTWIQSPDLFGQD